MSINLLVMGLLALVVGSYTWKAWSAGPDTLPPSFLPFTPIPVGKSTVYVSKTKDASMYIERQRRVAILQNRPFRPSYKGFTNGSVEVGLSGLILPPQKPVCGPPKPVIWSNGDADDAICDTVDAGGAFGLYDEIDFGGAADGNVCDT